MLSGQQGLPGQGEMSLRRGGDHHAVDGRPGQDLVVGQTDLDNRVLFPELPDQGLVSVADEFERAELMVVANQVLAPVSASDGGGGGSGIINPFFFKSIIQ